MRDGPRCGRSRYGRSRPLAATLDAPRHAPLGRALRPRHGAADRLRTAGPRPGRSAHRRPGRARPPHPPPAGAAPAAAKPAESKPAEAAKPAAATPKEGGSFRIHMATEDPPSLDPYLNVSFRVQEFAAYYYSRLLMSKKGPGIAAQAYIMEGDLAETWKVSPDGKTYTFNLRPNAKWQNIAPMSGRPVTGADVAWSFNQFMKVSPNKTAFDMVADVSAPSERVVEFKLKDAFAPFESLLGSPLFWILPKEVV